MTPPGRAADRIAAIVLAAGAGKRFGGRKQLALLDGRPLLEHALSGATEVSDLIVLVLGAFADEVERGVEPGDAIVARCPDWELGPGASLRTGLAALGPEVGAALILLGDEPFVPPTASRRLLAARAPGRSALRANYGGRPGHPVLIERSLFALFAAARPETRPVDLLRKAGLVEVECHDLGEPADVDTPAQLSAFTRDTRARRPR